MSCSFQQGKEINASHLEFPSNQSYLFKSHILQQLKQGKTVLSLRRAGTRREFEGNVPIS